MHIPRVLICLVLALTLGATLAPSLGGTSSAAHIASPGVAAQTAQQVGSHAALAVDLTSGLQLYNQNGDVPAAPASTLKLVTVLAARGILLPQEQVTIVESDLYLGEEYSQMGVQAGDVLTVESLFYGALLSSGADAALALARTAGLRLDPTTPDPVGRFVQEMNRYAASIGMDSSNFTNPVGEDAENNYTTARDLVRATERLLADPLLARIIATPEIVVPVGGPALREMYLVSTNELVLRGESIGGKTGTTDAAGQCLVNVTRRGEHVIVTVVMGSQDRFADTDALLGLVGEHYQFVRLGAGSTMAGLADELATLGLEFPVGRTVLMTPEQASDLRYELQLTSDDTAGGKAGVVIFSTGDRDVLALPVYATN